MVKQIKKLTMLLFVAATMLSFGACEKEDTDTPKEDAIVVADTEWAWRAEDPNSVSGVINIQVGFNGPALADLTYTDMSTGVMQTDALLGTYTYAGNKGTMTLEDDYSNTVKVPFTVSGTTMKITFKGNSYTLTKR